MCVCVCVCVCVYACVRACVNVCVNNLYILYCPSFLSLPLLLSQVERLKLLLSVCGTIKAVKDVTLSSLYFPEADKQTSSTGQLWYTAWCPLLQVRGGGGRGREE